MHNIDKFSNSGLFFIVFLAVELQVITLEDHFMIPIKLTYEGLPLLQIKHFCPDFNFDLIIDTGSTQLTLADA